MSNDNTPPEQSTVVLSGVDATDDAAENKARLVSVAGPELGSQFVLDRNLVIGRSPDCDIQLSAGGVSRQHCKILATDTGFAVEDLDSTNHTRVNDEVVKRQQLVDGDRIRLGRSVLKFVAADSPDAAFHDDLASAPRFDQSTGLYSINHLQEQLDDALQAAAASPDTSPGGVLVVTLDNAAALRERIGIAGTSKLLRQLAARLTERLGDEDIAARYSEFSLVVLVTGNGDQSLDQLAAGLCDHIAGGAFEVGGRGIAISASIGMCAFDLRVNDAETMLIGALRAAEKASAGGGRRWLAYRPRVSGDASDQDERALLGLLQAALQRNSIQVLFQPAVSIAESDTAHYQLLPRLLTDDDQLIPAARFVPLAERHDKIRELDLWMSVRATKVLEEQLANQRQTRLFVSQSRASLADHVRFQSLAGRLSPVAREHRLLVFEFARDDVLANLEAASQLLPRMRDLGLGVSISGISDQARPMDVLNHVPADYFKLAPDYAQRMVGDHELTEIFNALVAQAHKVDAQVIVPMVENAETMSRLWTSKADLLQGNFIQQPMQTPDFSL